MNRYKSILRIFSVCLAIVYISIISLNAEVKSNINNNKRLQVQFQKILDSALKEIKGTGTVCLIRTPNFQWIGSSGYSPLKHQGLFFLFYI